jgi:hypothetical protein
VVTRLAEWSDPDRFVERQELVRTLVDRVTVYPDAVIIAGVLPCVDVAATSQLPYTDAGERKQRAMPFYGLPY